MSIPHEFNIIDFLEYGRICGDEVSELQKLYPFWTQKYGFIGAPPPTVGVYSLKTFVLARVINVD